MRGIGRGLFTVLIVGGYGNFGGYIARKLASRADIQLVIAGRNLSKAQDFIRQLESANPAMAAVVDIANPDGSVKATHPDLVINMVGPYHAQNYALAEAAINCRAHYCDIADSRQFVCGIGELDEKAKAAGVAVIAGASSVPCLTAAYLDEAQRIWRAVHSVHYGISGAEQGNRGAGTVAAVLSYVGQPFTRLKKGQMTTVYGWGSLHAVRYPELGWRLFANGDVPDLGLFPARYPGLRDHSFAAGHEIAILHLGTWALGLLARIGLLPRLDRFAPLLLQMSKAFNWMGRGRSGFHMVIKGETKDGKPAERRHWIIARSGHGPNIPCLPAIVIAEKLAAGVPIAPGARPCLDLVRLDELILAMQDLDHSIIDEAFE